MMRGFLMCVLLSMSTLSIGQEIKWDYDNVPLSQVLSDLERAHGLLFSFKNEEVDSLMIDAKIHQADLEQALKQLFDENLLFYEIQDDNFVIVKKTSKATIEGRLLDGNSNEPMVYANIYLEGTNYGTSSDEEGNFVLDVTYRKADEITVSYVGYQSKKIPVNDFLKSSDLGITMMPYHDWDNFLVIKDYLSDGIELSDNGAATRLRPRMIRTIPATTDQDVFASAKLLPGVSSPTSKASDIRIRGCTPDQNLVIWEDIPIYHSAHYFGMITAINSFTIDEVNIYRGGFGAEYGGRIGGVIDLKSSDEKNEKPYFGLGSNMTHSYVYGNQQLPLFKKTAITFSVRRSFSELFRTPTFDNITKINQQGLLLGNKEVVSLPDHISIEDDFNFIDSHVKIASQLGDKDRIAISGFAVKNHFEDRIDDNKRRELHTDLMDLSNYGYSGIWGHQWTTKFGSEVKLIGTEYDYDYNYILRSEGDTRPRIQGTKSNMIRDQQFGISGNYELPRGGSMEAGYQRINYNIDFDIVEENRNGRDISDQASTGSFLNTFHATLKNSFRDIVGVHLGMRASHFGVNDKLYWEPRLRLSYKLFDDISIQSNYGRHFQFVSQVVEFRGNSNGINTALWALAEDQKIAVQSSDLYQLGLIYNKGPWVIDLQTYRREIKGLSSRAYNIALLDEGKASLGAAEVRGVDIMLKRRIKKLRTWLSYSLSQSDFHFPAVTSETFSSDKDQRHVLKWTNQINVNSFAFSLGYKFASGLPYSVITNFDVDSEPMGPDQYTPLYNDGINSAFLGSQHELNLSARYHFKHKDQWQGFLCLSVFNMFNYENLSSREYYIDSPKNQGPSIETLDKRN